ncbi:MULTISPECIES: class I SAM-dependent methyltransferase [Paenibacillus]|uniref:class I SAM-dependent methyltransferase n=1 Tax=Paenibacillus TaxID=44249 RepID=UPI0022B8FA58|nr:methyltransferase domain-containing protein [Paenibacillus caseinilyticus]MCZ8519150.1 methyltransferase domain-containing protein [Paenibacillus caseinilyticus]
MNLSAIVQEKLVFLHKFIQSPKEVGSVMPSSKYLAQAMTRSLDWDKTRHVAELGAGTGALTKYIEQAAGREAKVMLFEREPALRSQLKERFPSFTCHPDACLIQEAMSREGVEGLDAIISGLPFFNFPPQLRARLLREIVDSLRPGGSFIAFQYSLQMRSLLTRAFEIEAIRFVPLNVPPAFVYVCRKK